MQQTFDQIIDTFPDDSRVWVFVGEEEPSYDHQKWIIEAGKDFIDNWSAHGKSLHAACGMIGSAWVLVADESEVSASGCSMDKITRFVKSMSEHTGISFMNRSIVLLPSNGNWVQEKFDVKRMDESIHAAITVLSDLKRVLGN
jgi:hypothetical protein